MIVRRSGAGNVLIYIDLTTHLRSTTMQPYDQARPGKMAVPDANFGDGEFLEVAWRDRRVIRANFSRPSLRPDSPARRRARTGFRRHSRPSDYLTVSAVSRFGARHFSLQDVFSSL
jgi:hypothetical protein